MSTWLATYLQSPLGVLDGSCGKESVCNAQDLGSNPGPGRSPGGGHSNPLQHSCPEYPMDRGTWRATVHGVTELDTTESIMLQHPTRCFCHIINFYSVPWFHVTYCTHSHIQQRSCLEFDLQPASWSGVTGLSTQDLELILETLRLFSVCNSFST